jgi:hypothetical protein
MAHFAKLDKNNKVISVHIVANEVLDIENEEQTGIDFLSNLHNHTNWKQTSYNSRIRKNYAGIDFIYDEQLDAFIPPQPYPSWVLNEEICQWQAPKPMPEGDSWIWDEDFGDWVNAKTL